MGILGRSSTSEATVVIDPFEIYDDVLVEAKQLQSNEKSVTVETPASPPGRQAKKTTQTRIQVAPSQTNVRWITFGKRFVRHPGTLGLVLSLCGIFLITVKPWSFFVRPNLVYAYFEVRALDSNGRPIAGASVKNAGKQVGTTDSFGEWRRYMQVPLGGVVPLTLVKKTSQHQLLVTKNFAVPPIKPERSEIELRSSVQLLPAEAQQNGANISSEHSHLTRGSNLGSAASTDALVALNAKVSDESATLSHGGNEPKSAHDLSDSLAMDEKFSSDRDAIWIDVAGTNSGDLSAKVLPALTKKAKELGLRLERNASWTVQLTNLIDRPLRVARDGGGLIRVRSIIRENGKERAIDFLKNYQTDPGTTASLILQSLATTARKPIVFFKVEHRWAAALPRKSPKFWALSPQSVLLVSGQTVRLGEDTFANDGFKGLYIRKGQSIPCPNTGTVCVGTMGDYESTPPVASWQKMKVKIPNVNARPISVFVSGYAAKPSEENIFEFWGANNAKANVTVLHDGRLFLRGSVVGNTNSVAMLGGQSVSRR